MNKHLPNRLLCHAHMLTRVFIAHPNTCASQTAAHSWCQTSKLSYPAFRQSQCRQILPRSSRFLNLSQSAFLLVRQQHK